VLADSLAIHHCSAATHHRAALLGQRVSSRVKPIG